MFEKLQGQTLHAKILGFQHPVTNQYIEVESPLPQYFVELLKTSEIRDISGKILLDNYITIGVEFSYLANVREVTTCRIF